MIKKLFLFSTLAFSISGVSQTINLLTLKPIEQDAKDYDPNIPSLTSFIPEGKVTTGVLILPGGGYSRLSTTNEGTEVARWLNSKGIAAFILKYRHTSTNPHPLPLTDAVTAMKYIRSHQKTLGVSLANLGVIGFSAGGHLASTLLTHFDDVNANPSKDTTARPDFGILVYPVITMQADFTHTGSRSNIIGKNPSAEQVSYLSAEKNITSKTPPCFLVHSTDDNAVPVENSLQFIAAMKAKKRPADAIIYSKGGHGYGMKEGKENFRSWYLRCEDWMKEMGWL